MYLNRIDGSGLIRSLALVASLPVLIGIGGREMPNENPATGGAANAAALAEMTVPVNLNSRVPLPVTSAAADAKSRLAAKPFDTSTGSDLAVGRAIQCLADAIYYEAAMEGEEGQRAVAQVVLNRVRHPAFPHSVCGVVYQGSERVTGCQFTFTCDGSLARGASAAGMARARTVARRALAGGVHEPVGLATHYHANYVHPYWSASLDRITNIGAHIFYAWRGTAGTPGAFKSRYAGIEPSISKAALIDRASSVATETTTPIKIDATPLDIAVPDEEGEETAPVPSAPSRITFSPLSLGKADEE